MELSSEFVQSGARQRSRPERSLTAGGAERSSPAEWDELELGNEESWSLFLSLFSVVVAWRGCSACGCMVRWQQHGQDEVGVHTVVIRTSVTSRGVAVMNDAESARSSSWQDP